MAAAAGARRTETALDRLEVTTRSTDAIVFTSQVQDTHPNWGRLEDRPEIAALAPWNLLFGYIDGQPGGVLFASADGRWGTVVDKPVVLQGRMWNAHADEMVVDEQVAAAMNVHVGTVILFHAYAPDQPSTAGEPKGALVPIRVVGIVRDTEEFLFSPGGEVSPGVLDNHRGQIFFGPNAMVRLRPGEGGDAALHRDVSRIIGPNVPILDLQSVARRVTTTLTVEGIALWVLASAVALAGGLILLQMLARSVSFLGDDVRSLRALGLTRRDITAGVVWAHAVVLIGAAMVGLIVALSLSPLFPIGLGRQVDPDPGLHADVTVLGAGLVVTLVGLLCAIAIFSLSTMRRDTRSVLDRRSLITAQLRRIAPLPVSLGASAAFQRSPGAKGMPVRPALIGAVIGVLGVLGALTLDHGIHFALANPQVAGVTWGAEVSPTPADLTPTSVRLSLLNQVQHAAPDASIAVVRRDLLNVDGVGVPAYMLLDKSERAGPISLVSISGRPPRSADEVAIGPATAQLLHVRVGSWVELGTGRRVHIVGEALFPTDVHSEFDEGVWLIPSLFDRVVPPNTAADPDEVVAVRFPSSGGGEASALMAAEAYAIGATELPPSPINQLFAGLGGPSSELSQNVSPVDIPLELTNLGEIAYLPILLSIFLALLALAALSFALVTSSRSRRVELAVLRAMGLSAKATRRVVYWQAASIAITGLLVGIPLGILLGQWGWKAVADRVSLVYEPPLALVAILLAIPAAILLVTAVAALPAREVVSMRPAEALRSE